MPNLVNGKPFPEIVLTDTEGEEWRLSDHKGKMVLIHACRGEFCPTTRSEFTYWDSFSHLFKWNNTELVFLLRGGREQHRQFREQFKIRPRILIDEDGKVGEELGIYEPHSQLPNNGYHYYMAPSVFLVDSQGDLSCYWILSGPRGRPSPECVLGILAYAQHKDWVY